MEPIYIIRKAVDVDGITITSDRQVLVCAMLELHKAQATADGNESAGSWKATVNVPAAEYAKHGQYIEGNLLLDDEPDQDAAEYEYDGMTFTKQSLMKYHDFDGELRNVRLGIVAK